MGKATLPIIHNDVKHIKRGIDGINKHLENLNNKVEKHAETITMIHTRQQTHSWGFKILTGLVTSIIVVIIVAIINLT